MGRVSRTALVPRPYLAVWAFVRWQASLSRSPHDGTGGKTHVSGRTADNCTIGDPARAEEFAPLLAARAELLHDFGTRIKSGEL